MKTIAVTYRASQLVAHNLHNTVKGPSFFEDHEFLGELYGTYESAYDSIVERMIGLGQQIDIPGINTEAAKLAEDLVFGTDVRQWPVLILRIETAIRKELSGYAGNVSFGTNNLLAGLADDSEQRTYKVGQRSK